MILLELIISSITTLNSCKKDEETPQADPQLTNTEKAIAILEAIESGDVTAMQDYLNQTTYIQPLLGFLSTLPERTPFYQSMKSIHEKGNFALMISQGYPDQNKGLASAYYDLFRIENGEIIEHWDVVQTIPAEEDWANTNGKF